MHRMFVFVSLLLIWVSAAYGGDYATHSNSEVAKVASANILGARSVSETASTSSGMWSCGARPRARKEAVQIVTCGYRSLSRPRHRLLRALRFSGEAYIEVDAFENLLYRDPSSDQVVTQCSSRGRSRRARLCLRAQRHFGADPDVSGHGSGTMARAASFGQPRCAPPAN